MQLRYICPDLLLYGTILQPTEPPGRAHQLFLESRGNTQTLHLVRNLKHLYIKTRNIYCRVNYKIHLTFSINRRCHPFNICHMLICARYCADSQAHWWPLGRDSGARGHISPDGKLRLEPCLSLDFFLNPLPPYKSL